MSESFGEITNTQYHKPACRVAYTLNNRQPVLCSIISDQPVFYMDVEENSDDIAQEEIFLELDNLRLLENEIHTLQKEIQALHRMSADHAKAPDARFHEIAEDKEIITAPGAERQGGQSVEILLGSLKNSRIGMFYLEFAHKHGVEILHSPQVASATYERKFSKILVNPSLTSAEQTVLLSRELRRHWQHRQGALIHPLMFHPDHAILVNRLQVADLATAMVRIAWELQLAGDKGAWEYIENSQMADLGRAFAREAYLDFRTLNNGQASAALVENWFLSERCRTQDKILIRQMLADYRGYVFDKDQSAQTVTPALIGALGSVPYGSNYLAKHAQTIMADPIFTEIRDRSNANFLWFIKFEQSYKQTEQGLQGESQQGLSRPVDNCTNNSLQSEFNPKAQVPPHAARETVRTAEIVCFVTRSREARGEREAVDKLPETGNPGRRKRVGRAKRGSKSAQILYLTRTSAE